MKLHRHIVLLNDENQEMYEELLGKGLNRQEIFRMGLREVHRREAIRRPKPSTNSTSDKPEDNGLTPEEHCVRMLEGEVVGDSCLIKWPSGLEHKVALFRVKEFNSREDLPI